jgi:hypothetical protein
MKLCSWHLSIIERICKQKTTTTNISTTTNGVYTSPTVHSNNDRTLNQKRRDIDIFPGFLPAIEICQIDWMNCSYYPSRIEKTHEVRLWSEYIRYYDEILTDGYGKLNNNTNLNLNTQQLIVTQPMSVINEELNSVEQDTEEKCQDIDSGEESFGGGNVDQQSSSNSSDECRIYFSDRHPSKTQRQQTTTTAVIAEPYILKILKTITDPLQVYLLISEFIFEFNFFSFQIAFVRCEALRIHGYHNEVFKLAKQLADHMLNSEEYSSSSRGLFLY